MACEFLRTFAQRILAILFAVRAAAALARGSIQTAKTEILLFLAVYMIGAIIGSGGELLANRAADERYRTLLIAYYNKLTGKDMAFYREYRTGSLADGFRKHLDGSMNLVRLLRGDFARMSVSLTFPLLVLFVVNWRLGIILTMSVAVQIIYVFWASQLANKYRKVAQEIYHRLTGEVADEITNIVAFKASGRDAEAQGNVVALATQEARAYWPRHKLTILLDLPRALVTGLSIALTFYVALGNTSSRLVPPAWSIVLVLIYSLQLMQSIGDLPDLVLRYDEHIARVYPTLKYLDAEHETIVDPANPAPLVVSDGAITFNDVHFAYKSFGGQRHVVFSGLTFSISGGEHVGIVGVSGAGKTTLVNLLLRFDEVNAGFIAIDGRDIRTTAQRELRQAIAYVPQEPILFHRTIKDNIAFLKTDCTQDAIVEASQAAYAHEFIDKLERGYNTMVGERGTTLSGGQRQRIILARAILQNAPIMIFDEATSSLDSESEKIIQDALPTVIGQHTALVIAHRLSTVAHLDRIIVLDEGKIVETGTHKELLALGGRYRALWGRQAAEMERKGRELA